MQRPDFTRIAFGQGAGSGESAKRAILTCQPFTMLRAEHYQQWKDIEITFDPREMFGG